MKVAFLLFLSIVLTACRKKDDIDTDALHNNTITIIGHGGAGFQTGRKAFPTNSLLSIHNAIDVYSAAGVEVDVQLSKDSHVIMYHDENLDGYTSCSGYISDFTYNELQQCKYRQDFAVSGFLDERIASLEELLIRYQYEADKPLIFLDTKYYPYSSGNYNDFYTILAREVINLCLQYNYQQSLIVEGHDLNFLLKIKEQIPDLQVFFAGNFEESFDLVLQNGLDGMTLKNHEATKEQIAKAHSLNKKIALYLINDRKTTVEAISKSPDFIQTDNIILAQQVLMY